MAKKELKNTQSSFSRNPVPNRAEQVRRDNDIIKTPKCTIEDVDFAIISYIRDVLKLQVTENGQIIDVPIMYANGEKWAQVQAKGYMRDRKGKIMTPVVSIRRGSIIERDTLKSLGVNNNPAGNDFVHQNKHTIENKYDRFSVQHGSQRKKEFYIAPVPEFVDVSYELLLWTEYTEQMNAYVREKVAAALESDGIEEIIKLVDEENKEQDIFDLDYLANIEKIKLPNTKIQLLQNLLKKAIGEMKKVNRIQGIEFSKKMQAVVDRYNERKDNVYSSEEFEEIANELTTLIMDLKAEFKAGDDLGIDFEEKAFYDILKSLAQKYDFSYPDDRLLNLAKEVKVIVDDKSRYTDWSERSDIKAELKVDLILLLGENDYPPVDRDEVYKEIFEQAENFKKNR